MPALQLAMGFCTSLCPCFHSSDGKNSRTTDIFITDYNAAGGIRYSDVSGREGATPTAPQGKCLAFVHGFNTDRDRAVKTAESIASKLATGWSVVVYHWSNNTAKPALDLQAIMRLYIDEERQIPQASTQLKAVLADLQRRCSEVGSDLLLHNLATYTESGLRVFSLNSFATATYFAAGTCAGP